MMIIMGNARIEHADTGVVYEIDKALLDFRVVEMHENEMKNEIRYLAELEHPELGKLTWELREYPSGLETHHATNVSPHKLLEDIIFRYIDDKSDKNNTRKIKIDAMVEWFHKNYEDPNNELPYDKDDEYGFAWVYGGPCDAREELQDNFPDESEEIIEAAVKKIQSDGMVAWSPIVGPEFFGEEPQNDDEIAEINSTLNTLIDNAPEPTTDPAFALNDNNQLYITEPPDNQPVDSQDDLLNELRAITDDLLQSLRGANAHQDLIPIIEKYKEALSGNQMSISRLYGRGVRLDNVVRAIKRGIEAKEQPSLSLNTESNLNSVLEIHGAYIMSSADGRQLAQDAVDYHQPPEQPEGFKEAVEQFSNSIKNNSALFDESVREYVPNIVMDIGTRQLQKRSDKIGERTLTHFVSALLKGIRKVGVKAIQWIVVSEISESTLGQMAITATTNRINAIWGFLTNIASSFKTITDYLSPESSWLESASKIILRIISMIMGE